MVKMSEESKKSFSEYIYNVENLVDEFVLAFLSFGTIVVTIWAIFFSAQNVDMLSFGKIIEPWISMLALMMIAREIWLMRITEGDN